MSWLEEHREKKIRKENQKYADDQKEMLKRIKTDDQGKRSIEAYISPRKIIRKLLPYLVISGVLGFIEYRLIGPEYTIGSIALYLPIMYLYTRSLQSRAGVYLLTLDRESGQARLDTYIIPNELWGLIHFTYPPMPSWFTLNGRMAYMARKVKRIPGTNIFYHIDLAYAHSSPVDAMFGIDAVDRLSDMVYNLEKENTELKNLKNLQSLIEGVNEKEAAIEMMSKYKGNPLDIAREIKRHEENIQRIVDENKDLIDPPDVKSEDEEAEEE